MGFGKVLLGARIDGGGLRIEGEAQVPLDSGHRGAHFVGGGGNEFGLLVFVGEFFGDVAEGDDFVVGGAARGDHGEMDCYLTLVVAGNN